MPDTSLVTWERERVLSLAILGHVSTLEYGD